MTRLGGIFNDQKKYLILSGVVTLSVNLIIYQSVLNAGFWSDDYHMIAPAARLTWWDFLTYYIDPRVQWIWYRPVQGIQVGILYMLFGNVSFGYHLAQLLLHCANTLLLLELVTHVSRRWRIGLVAALIYGTWSILSLAVYWPTVADPLLAFFCLSALRLWIHYLETEHTLAAVFAYVTLFAGLGTKENGVVVPILFFLADRWIVGKPVSPVQLFKRYSPFVFVFLIYAALEFDVVLHSAYTRDSGYGIGSHIVPVLVQYLGLLAFPWDVQSPLVYLWLVAVLGILVYVALTHRWRILFVAACALLTLAPVMLFRSVLPRYLYLPAMASAVLFALLIEWGRGMLERFVKSAPAVRIASVLIILGMIWSGGATIAEGGQNYTGFVRQVNLKLQPVFQRHTSFAPGTLLYFVDPPFAQINVAGAMAFRYGANVTVDGRDGRQRVGLGNYKAAFVYYEDEQEHLQEIAANPTASVRTSPDLPVQFGTEISLDGFELTNSTLTRGEAVAFILYWRAIKKIDEDYTVFVHLVDAEGNLIASVDSQPKRGSVPTSTWAPGALIVDAIVLPIDVTLPASENLRVRIGLYLPSTGERLAILNARGEPIGDSVVLERFASAP